MKRIFFSGMIFMSLFIISSGFGADETVTSPGKVLTVEEWTGTDDAYLGPTMFPNFYRDVSENPRCADYLMDGDTDTRPDWNNGTGKDRWTPTRSIGKYVPTKEEASTEKLEKGEYQGIPGLLGTVKPAKGYRKTTKILFTWTVRLEGYNEPLAVWPFICDPHHGTSYQEFPPGSLKTQLYVKGTKYQSPFDDGYAQVGQIAEMTVPSSGKGTTFSNSSDPTITGSYALLPSDFVGGRIPLEVVFEIRWYNETSMKLKSPGKQRNVIATVFPVTSQRSEE